MSDKFTVGAREAMLGESPSYDKRPAPHVTNTDPSLRDQMMREAREDAIIKKYDTPILNERETTHGDYRVTAEIAQKLKHNLIGMQRAPLTAVQRESLDMICTKLARIVCGNPNEPDHWKDIAGYANLVYERLVK